MSHNTDYTNVLLESMDGKIDLLVDAISGIHQKIDTLATKDELRVVAADVKTIKQAIKATNHDVAQHEVRITALETVA